MEKRGFTYMRSISELQKSLEGIYASAPALPKNISENIAKVTPWLALVFAILQIIDVLSLGELLSQANRIEQLYDSSFNIQYAQIGLTPLEELFVYLGIALLIIEIIILLTTVPKLIRSEKAGWDRLFLVVLINILFAIVTLVTSNYSIGNFLWNIAICGVGFYFLFQIRSFFSRTSQLKHIKK